MMKAFNWLGVAVLAVTFVAAVMFVSGGCRRADVPEKPVAGVTLVAQNGLRFSVYSFTTEDGTFYVARSPDGVSLIKVK